MIIRPTLNLNFKSARQLGPITSFSRASIATYFDSNGVLRAASHNQPRFNFDPVTGECRGLLIEEQRTNLFTYSQDFRTTEQAGGARPWIVTGPIAATPDAGVAPDGSLTANKLVLGAGAAGGAGAIFQSVVKPGTSAVYTASLYAKAGEFDQIRLIIRDTASAANNADCRVSLANGTYVVAPVAAGTFTAPSGSVTYVGSGWWRIALTVTSWTEAAINARLFAYNSFGANGDGASGIFIWGAQLEQGGFSSSYIPATSAQVTRAAESVAISTLSPWFNPVEGTFLAEADYIGGKSTTDGRAIFCLDDGSGSNLIAGLFSNNANRAWVAAVSAGVAQLTNTQFADAEPTAAGRLALAYKKDDVGAAFNGANSYSDASVIVPTVSSLRIGAYSGGNNRYLNGHIQRLSYYPRRFLNGELEVITK